MKRDPCIPCIAPYRLVDLLRHAHMHNMHTLSACEHELHKTSFQPLLPQQIAIALVLH